MIGMGNMRIDFDKMQGLVPAIVQDFENGDILMLGFMNGEAWEKTMNSGYVTFYSRTRDQLWTKGETSGNRLKVISAATDCDFDSLLLRVAVEGEGVVCHEGTRSCFTKIIPGCTPVQRGPDRTATRSAEETAR
jgi:phosphoribosyl-ATP pyrophosphohydrolase/phosphoribosyl-AMP cyclohydrolase